MTSAIVHMIDILNFFLNIPPCKINQNYFIDKIFKILSKKFLKNITMKRLILFIILIITIFPGHAETNIADMISIDHKIYPDLVKVQGSGFPDYSTVIIKISGTGNIPKRPIDAVLVMDLSNSMSEPHLSAAKNAVRSFMDRMDDSIDKIGFVGFNSTLGPYVNPDYNYEKINDTINAINIDGENPEGSTCMSIGLTKAIEMLGNLNDSSVKIILFLSDGDNKTCRKKDNPCADSSIANSKGIIVYSIGLNDTGLGTENLACMAKATGGSCYSTDSQGIEEIYSEIANNIQKIIAKDLLLEYAYSDGISIEDVDSKGPGVIDNSKNLIYKYIGSISSNETKELRFKVYAAKSGEHYLGLKNKSSLGFIGYNGVSDKIGFEEKSIIAESGGNGNKVVQDIPFLLQAKGSNITRIEPNTSILVTKNIFSGPFGPHITIDIKAPKFRDIKTAIVISIDSSGSLGKGGRPEYGENVRQSIPKILDKINNTMDLSNVSIISWDNDIDFAYASNNTTINREPSKAIMVPISRAKNEIESNRTFGTNPNFIDYLKRCFSISTISSSDNGLYYCHENESTDLNLGLESARIILNNTIIDRFDATRKLILFITARSEFTPCDPNIINRTKKEDCFIHTIGVGVADGSDLQKELIKIAGDDENLTGDRNSYHYSPGSSYFNHAAVATAVEAALKQYSTENISDNIAIVDTLYPYLRIKNNQIEVKLNKENLNNSLYAKEISLNSDGTTTLRILFKKDLRIRPEDRIQVSFDTYLDLSLPRYGWHSKISDMYLIDHATPRSEVSYNWLGNKQFYNISLPESKINLNANGGA
jgi:hypothetical protein